MYYELQQTDLHVPEQLYGTREWLEAGRDTLDPLKYRLSKIPETQLPPLAEFSEQFHGPHSRIEGERHAEAVEFLGRQGVSNALLQTLRTEFQQAGMASEPEIANARAVIRAEALARGQIDPWAFLLLAVTRRAVDYE